MIVITKKPNAVMRVVYRIINKIFALVDRMRWTAHYMTVAGDFDHIGKNVVIDYGVFFGNAKNISIGDDVFIGKDAIINASRGGRIELCKGSAIGAGSTIITWNADLMGNRHLTRPLHKSVFKDVVIGRGAGLGYNCTINPGVTLGDGCEVAAGSVVVSNVDDFEVVGGAPAKVIAIRGASS